MKAIIAVLVVVAVGILGSSAGPSLHAQQTTDSSGRRKLLAGVPADTSGDRASKMVEGIRADVARADTYFSKLVDASPEDSLVLRLQVFEVQTGGIRKLHELADVLVEMESRSPQEQLRAEVENTYEYVTPRLWLFMDFFRREIDSERARRDLVPVAKRMPLEDRIARLTERLTVVMELARVQIEKLDKLGLDSSAARASFAELLEERADEVSGRIALATERIGETAARQREEPSNADVKTLLKAEQKCLKTNTDSMASVLSIMDAFKLSTRDYRAQLVMSTRDLTSGMFNREVADRLVSTWSARAMKWLSAKGPGMLVKVFLFVGIILLFRLLSRLARSGVGHVLDGRANVSMLLRRMAVQSTGRVVMLLGFLIALAQMGLDPGPMVAGLGVAGFIVGFALQNTLANFAAGVMILMYRPYDVGDVIDVTGAFGKVEKMSLVSTSVITADNQMIVVPNSKIWGDVIKNVTEQHLRRVDMVFGISYSDDIPKAEGVLLDILKAHPRILDDPAPAVKVHKLGESSVDFVVRPWVARDDYWDVYWDITREVKLRFDREGISIPFPQRDVHVHTAGGDAT